MPSLTRQRKQGHATACIARQSRPASVELGERPNPGQVSVLLTLVTRILRTLPDSGLYQLYGLKPQNRMGGRQSK
eukprot:4907856-Lingulodinium_polyedra.AAC.1